METKNSSALSILKKENYNVIPIKKLCHENSSSSITNSDTSSDTNNDTITLGNSKCIIDNLNRFGQPRRFYGKSKSAAVSRSASNTSRVLKAENIYIDNSSDEPLSSSDSETLNSDEEEKSIYKPCKKYKKKNSYLKKSMSKPECQINSYRNQSEKNHRYLKNSNSNIRCKSNKNLTSCNDSQTFLINDQENNENEECCKYNSILYNQLDGQFKNGRLSRFKIIKSKSNSVIQNNKLNFDNNFDDEIDSDSDDIKEIAKMNTRKEKKVKNEINNQFHINELAKKLRYIEKKLIENELNTEKKFQNIIINHSNKNFDTSKNQDDSYLNNGQFNTRMCPSNSFGDCSQINHQPKNLKKRHFFSSAKSAVKNSKSIPSLFILSSKEKSSSEKNCIDKLNDPPKTNLKLSSSKIWKAPFNILGNLVDEKILKGRWNSSKSVKSNSNSIRSNSICSTSPTSNFTNSYYEKDNKNLNKFNDFNKKSNTINLNKKIYKKNVYDQNCVSSNNSLANSDSSKFSSTKNLNKKLNDLSLNQKARAHSTPNEEILSLLNKPFLDEDKINENYYEKEKNKILPSKSYKEIGSKALAEIEEFEKLISKKFSKEKFN